VNAPSLENWVSVMVTAVYGLVTGNTCWVGSTPIGPTTFRSAFTDGDGQPPPVVECMAAVLVPGSGETVLPPRVPGGGFAPANPLLTSSADPVATATTTAPDHSRVNKVFLRTV
jgi:hypothetical protein